MSTFIRWQWVEHKGSEIQPWKVTLWVLTLNKIRRWSGRRDSTLSYNRSYLAASVFCWLLCLYTRYDWSRSHAGGESPIQYRIVIVALHLQKKNKDGIKTIAIPCEIFQNRKTFWREVRNEHEFFTAVTFQTEKFPGIRKTSLVYYYNILSETVMSNIFSFLFVDVRDFPSFFFSPKNQTIFFKLQRFKEVQFDSSYGSFVDFFRLPMIIILNLVKWHIILSTATSQIPPLPNLLEIFRSDCTH